jgi:hypothetical protein
MGRILGQLLWKTPKDDAFVVFVADGDSGSCELLAFVSEAGKECPDVSSLLLVMNSSLTFSHRSLTVL